MKLQSPKRLLMTTDTVGGVWTYALELAAALGTQEIEVALATMGPPLNDSQRQELTRCPSVRLFESTHKLEWMPDPWADVLKAGDWLLDLEKGLRPDLIHLNSFCHGALPWRAPRVVVGHSCVLSWWRAVHSTDAPPEWDRYRERVYAGLQAADLVIAPSQSMLAMLAEQYGPFGAWKVVYNGRSPSTPVPVSKEPFILAAGRIWDAAKNIKMLADVAPGLSWPVYIAGEGLPSGNGAERVRHLGRLSLDELSTWFNRAGIYALPAKYEPFGLSALEAGLAGCALVLGDIPSLREIWGSAAWFVPPNDPRAFQDALNRFAAEPELRGEFGLRARARAVEYTPARMLEGYLAAYTEASGQSWVPAPRNIRVPRAGRRKVVPILPVPAETMNTTELAA